MKETAPDINRFLTGIKKAYFLFSRDTDGSIISVSPSVTNILGYGSLEFPEIFPHFLKVQVGQKGSAADIPAGDSSSQPFSYEMQVNHKNGEPRWLKIIELPVKNNVGKVISVDCLAHDITSHNNQKNTLIYREKTLRSALGKSIRALAATVESRDYFSYGHHQRASSMARTIAQELGLSAQKTDTIRLAGVIHDIGKIGVPTEILNKRTQLSDTEYGFVRNHPETGYNILKNLNLDYPLAEIVRQHHERLDGSGYPHHLAGDQILPEARILAVADVIEAMSSDRAHRAAMKSEDIMCELSSQKGILFDPDVVDTSLRLISEKKFII